MLKINFQTTIYKQFNNFFNILKINFFSSMNKNTKQKENIEPVQMFSKIGRYISQKIVRIKSNKSLNHKIFNSSSLSKLQTKQQNKQQTISLHDTQIQTPQTKIYCPSVGHYKIKYTLIDKHLPNINLKKSLPHFSKDKYSCYQNTIVQKEYPDQMKKKIIGFKQLKRMTCRQDIKGSIRKTGENPNEKRFEKSWDHQYWTDFKDKKSINFNKMLKRNNMIFKNLQFSPNYDINFEINKKKLATNIVGFDKQIPRTNQYFVDKTCLSQQFQLAITPKLIDKTVKFQKLLPRYNQQDLPSYLDNRINNRLTLTMKNWNTLKMNCTQINAQTK